MEINARTSSLVLSVLVSIGGLAGCSASEDDSVPVVDIGFDGPGRDAGDVDKTSEKKDGTTLPDGVSDDCKFADDGTCDEPSRCELGTDQTDCREACKNADSTALFGAACEYRGLADRDSSPTYSDPDPSGGSSHLTGWRDATVEVPRGSDLSTTIPRHFRIFVPRSYDPDEAHPVMITMPGHRVSHWVLDGYTMLHRTAAMNDFIVVYAGQEFRSRGQRWAFWTEWYGSDLQNPPGFCKQKKADSNPDFEFIRKIIDWTSREYNVDQRRIYLSGHSRGASMALIAALEMPNRIAGAAVESGFTECGFLNEIVGEETWSERKVPIFLVHGTEDGDVCINCKPGEQCATNSLRSCSPGLHASDPIARRLNDIGWTPGENLRYARLERVAHRWQTQLNQEIWDFLSSRPLPGDQ